ncbi:hypothetical protein GCM10009616_28640 [Microlunatus lacustris]
MLSKVPWVSTCLAELKAGQQRGVVPDVGEVFGLASDDVRAALAQVRAALGMPSLATGLVDRPLVGPEEEEPGKIEKPDFPGQQSKARITSASLQGFRGCPKPLVLSLEDAEGKPRSLVLSGDNGVGKSSLVSAIEFACQGSVSRISLLSAPGSPEVVTLTGEDAMAHVEVKLSDGRSLKRTVRRTENGFFDVTGDAVMSDFSLAPMSLQRSDIVGFLTSSPNDRGRLFIDHFRGNAHSESPVDTHLHLKQRAESLRAVRRSLVLKLAAKLNLEVAVGNDAQRDLEEVIRRGYLDGLSQAEWIAKTGTDHPEAGRVRAEFEVLSSELQELNRLVKAAEAGSVAAYPERIKRFKALLGDLDSPLTRAVQEITGYRHIKSLQVRFGKPSSVGLDISVTLENGRSTSPERVFSEGVQDLIAFLFFLEVARAAAHRGQARILILDDVIQSVDASVRVRLMDYILREFADWQLLITVHDKAWREQLKEMLQARQHRHVSVTIRAWSFDDGPRLWADQSDESMTLRSALESSIHSAVAAEAGWLLERTCDRLSWTLPVSLKRTPSDRYTLQPLWDTTSKVLRRTNAAQAVLEVERWLHLRNLLGAHYNDFAKSLADSDADAFARAVLELWEAVWCRNCRTWISGNESAGWRCKCGTVEVTRGERAKV